MGKLENKVAIITGAAQGMGAMHARKFVEEGAKVVVTGMTKGAAAELGPFNIRVNSVHPGIIETPMAEQGDVYEYIKQLEKDIPLRRTAKPEEVSNLVIYLASDDSSYSTGSQFVVDGGMISDL